MKKIAFVFLIMGTVLLGGTTIFAESINVIQENAAVSFPDTSTWVLTRIGGSKAKQHTGSKVFIAINKQDEKVSGYTSCNTFRGKMIVQDTSITFSGVINGKRVCDEATTLMEKKFFDTLQKTTSWKIEGTILHLYEKGILILEFKNASGK
jgi:heat shock protein HslJ